MASKNLSFASITASTNGVNTIVAGATGRRIKVYHYLIVASAAVGAQWKSNTTVLSGNMPLDVKGGVEAESENGLFICNSGEDLKLVTDAAATISGHIAYEMV